MIESHQVWGWWRGIIDADSVHGSAVPGVHPSNHDDSTPDSAPGHPVGERVGDPDRRVFPFLGDRKAAEFTAPDHWGFVQQSPLIEVGKQPSDGLVRFAGEPAVVSGNVLVAIPASLVLHST